MHTIGTRHQRPALLLREGRVIDTWDCADRQPGPAQKPGASVTRLRRRHVAGEKDGDEQ